MIVEKAALPKRESPVKELVPVTDSAEIVVEARVDVPETVRDVIVVVVNVPWPLFVILVVEAI